MELYRRLYANEWMKCLLVVKMTLSECLLPCSRKQLPKQGPYSPSHSPTNYYLYPDAAPHCLSSTIHRLCFNAQLLSLLILTFVYD